MRDPPGRARAVRLLGAAGALGGLLWAALPVGAALAFYGVESGLVGVGGLLRVGALFEFAGAPVVLMLAGVAGVHRRCRRVYGRAGRVGAAVAAVGFVLLLPGSVVPSGSLPDGLSGVVPLVFFAGLILVALGSAVLGVAALRAGVLPPGLAVPYAVAMPSGAAVGAVAALAGAGNIAFVLGLMVPYGLAWVALGGYLARGAR